MSKSHFRSRPPRIDSDPGDAADAFIEAAEKPETAPTIDGPEVSNEPLPWEDAHVREDVKKLFSLRLPEPLMLKLQYISSRTGKSMHQYCLEHLAPRIEQDADDFAKKG